jgi:uncharacterized DUF497 family protein
MKITYDSDKRLRALEERGLDFLDAALVFEGEVFEFPDLRKEYGEIRIIAVGYLVNRMVIVGYVQRGKCRHIFSMRKANEREIKKYQKQFERK